MQDKIWFIIIDGQKEGPFSIQDLKHHPRMTPDTLVWKEGFKQWIPARKVAELKSIFEDEEPLIELHDRFKISGASADDSALVIEGSNFPFLFYLIIIVLLVLVYFIYKMNGLER